ncbi:MAG: hypothetical protein GW836_12055 [Paraglaciecola sp.]|nr:hypothetical protein [Paraglaciecola sp.]
MKKLTLISFGFKYGAPNANYYFDVSFAKNPARESQWSLFDEPDPKMVDYVIKQEKVQRFLEKVIPLIEVLGTLDDDARVAFGCNAGRHRSAIIVEYVAELMKQRGHDVAINHREWTKHA